MRKFQNLKNNSIDQQKIIFVNSLEELKNNFGNWVKFNCLKCNKEVFIHVNKYKPNTYNSLLCPKCKRENTCLKKYRGYFDFQVTIIY